MYYMSEFHTSVLLQEVISYLDVSEGKQYIDATLGGGGHSVEILKRGGIVLGIDQDEEAVSYAASRVQRLASSSEDNVTLKRGNFKDIREIAIANGFESVAGILFDLGVSSHQLDSGVRGFSFNKEAPLDMRMDRDMSVRAADLVNGLNKHELQELFLKLGEEYRANKIAEAIIKARETKRIETTGDLAGIIEKISGKREKIHPATKVFQALRIAVNDELNNLKEALEQSVALLQPKGRLVIISFHSLEDRIVKNAFLDFESKQLGTILTKKPIVPGIEEQKQNRRSRSAKMRAFEKNQK